MMMMIDTLKIERFGEYDLTFFLCFQMLLRESGEKNGGKKWYEILVLFSMYTSVFDILFKQLSK